jgi:malonyl CoA-acyl carrier protein transacylase/phosphopantetheinyl transferase (holo-ACP synthase)
VISAPNGHAMNGLRYATLPSTDAEPVAWDTELFVLTAGDRGQLRLRVQTLLDYLERHTDASLKDLAYTLNTDPAGLSGASCLAVVAGSQTDLHGRLTRAAERLGDPKCRQIKDTQGIYYFDQPLYREGKLALLFPGEGAQYLNMLADLMPHFPEVRQHFERCDRLRINQGNEPVCPHLFVPAGLSDTERLAAEKNLWRLGNAVSSILIAEWSLHLILQGLGLQPDVIGGHSAGEFSALLAAGCIEPDDFFIEQLADLCRLLQGLEDDGQLAEMALFAVGTSRRNVLEALESKAGVFVAMDNCPHQTVIASPPAAIPIIEGHFQAQGIMFERLPFRRPYHTPLFEPFLPSFVEMYARFSVRPPRIPVYSCTTGQLFPSDPDAIRRLAIAHWASPVEFIRMAEAMYADGVRLFVEAGPRGNLTSFLEDILRGKPAAAVASNVLRRSGVTQLNHLAGQLLAHHVPLRLDHFYRRREPQRIAWEGSGSPATTAALTSSSLPPPQPSPTRGEGEEANRTDVQLPCKAGAPVNVSSPRGDVMLEYCGVMEQFLDLQREVMEQYLARRSACAASSEPLTHRSGVSGSEKGVKRTTILPLLGDVIEQVPGQSLVMRRRIDLQEDLYAMHHTLGGRHASAVDPDHNGLPVMPMAFSLEMMAEAAAFLLPGFHVIGMRRVRLHRWIPLDEQPVTLEINARVVPHQPGQIAVSIRDLGNASHPNSAESSSVEGVVLLGERYPEAPPPGEFSLTNEGPCAYTPAQLYAQECRMFHGPLFQAVCATDRQGEEGIEGRLVTLPHSGLFRSTPQPQLLTDPLLIDASTHLLGCWHLGRPDQTGRVVFPYELGAVDLYGPPPPEGTQLLCRVRVERSSARQVSHRIELVGPDGRLWCRLAPAEYWRFYWPLEYVNFFRFKEQSLLGNAWPVCPGAGADACCLKVTPPEDLCHPVKRGALARITLTRAEWQRFYHKVAESERTDFLFSRIAAKDAIRSLWQTRHGQQLFPADLELVTDHRGRLQASYRGTALVEDLPFVSMAHVPGMTAALASFARQPGISLRRLPQAGTGRSEMDFDDTERALLASFGPARDEAITRFHCAREAAVEALGPALAEPRGVAVRAVDVPTGRILVALGPRVVAEYPELRLDLLIVYTAREGDVIVATTFCERASA